MKKFYNIFAKINVLLFILVLSIPTVLGINKIINNKTKNIKLGGFAAVSQENDVIENDTISNNTNFAYSYFRNLKRGSFGYNNIYICGYVAIGMLLSYYDTYWNDDLIPEKFDKTTTIQSLNISDYNNSPGLKERLFSSEDWMNCLFTDDNLDYFVPNLVKTAYNNGYYSIEENNIVFTKTTFAMISSVLEIYLANHQSLSRYAFLTKIVNNEYDYKSIIEGTNTTNSQKLRNEVIQYVKKGVPVMVGLSGATPESTGHVVIAYDYNSSIDKIYGHFGWYNISSGIYKDIESELYNNISSYIVLTPNCNHKHSNNMLLDGSSVCSCKLSNHIHEYVKYTKILNNEVQHNAICYCGYSEKEDHFFRVVGNNLVCKDCGYSKKYDGSFFPIIIDSEIIEKEIYNTIKGE